MDLEILELQIQEKIKRCKTCNKTFNKFQLRRKNQIYCSRLCHRNSRRRVTAVAY